MRKKAIDTFHQPLTHSLEIASDALVEQILRMECLTFRMTGMDTKNKDVQRIKPTDNDANPFRARVIFTIRKPILYKSLLDIQKCILIRYIKLIK